MMVDRPKHVVKLQCMIQLCKYLCWRSQIKHPHLTWFSFIADIRKIRYNRLVKQYWTLKNAVFWDVAPCRSCELSRRFGGTRRLHLQGRKIRERGTSLSRWTYWHLRLFHTPSFHAHYNLLFTNHPATLRCMILATRKVLKWNESKEINILERMIIWECFKLGQCTSELSSLYIALQVLKSQIFIGISSVV
jgi:hypothetical protein